MKGVKIRIEGNQKSNYFFDQKQQSNYKWSIMLTFISQQLIIQNLKPFNIIIIKMAEQQRARRKPTELSDFEGLIQIGHGAFGKVFRGTHKQTKKVFALKKISKRQVKAQNMITQLNNQIKISKQLDHTNIVKLYDTFDDGEDIYLVLELAPNGQLFSKICREGKLDERTTKQIIKEVLEAVAYLHSRNPPIIHRDIKPENILLDKNNHVKLADFGWSNFLNKPRKTYCGTFDYLAPEMIDKSGHDEKLDIWCLGVLAYELLTGKTPFVVSGPKNEIKKIIEQNILEVNISFPNDFPILAKSFILGMVKRKPEERLTLKDIMNHQWLTAPEISEKPMELIPMTKKGQREVPLIDAQDNNIIASLNKRIKQLQQEVNRLRINEKALTSQSKGITDNPDYITLMNELRKLRGVEEKNIQLKNDNEKYWEDLNKKDKEIIQLKGQIKLLQDNQESIDKLKTDKKSLLDKIRKLEKDLENSEIKNAQLSTELSGISDSLSGRLSRGEKIKLSEVQSHEFIELLQNQIQELEEKFEESKTILQKALLKEKMTKEKEDQLIRLRAEQKRIYDQIKSELKEEYQQQKDKIILEARTQLIQQREKWLKERSELQKIFEEQSSSNTGKAYNSKDDLELQLKAVRELQSYNQSTINELKIRIRQLEQENRRKK